MTLLIIDVTGYRVTGVELSATHQRYGYVSAFDAAYPLSWAYGPSRLSGEITFVLSHGERQDVMGKVARAAGARTSLRLPLGQDWLMPH